MQHMLVLLVNQFGPGTLPEVQSESLLPAGASHIIAGPTDLATDKDKTSPGLPTDSASQGPGKADPFLLPATTATGTWMTSQGQGHSVTQLPTVVVGPITSGSFTSLHPESTTLAPAELEGAEEPARATNKQTQDPTLAPNVDELRAQALYSQDFSYSANVCPNCMTTAHSFLQQSQSVV